MQCKYSLYTPYPVQEDAIYDMLNRKKLLLALPTGAGKTFCSLYSFGLIKEQCPEYKAWICSTASSSVQWYHDIKKITQGFSVESLVGESPKFRQKFFENPNKPDIVLTNYDLLRSEDTQIAKMLSEGSWVSIRDESHACKSRGTSRIDSMTLIDRAMRAPYRWLLSATPVLNGYEELFTQIRMLDSRVFPSWKGFLDDFCKTFKMKVPGQRWKIERIVGYKNIEALIAKINPWMFYKAKAALQLPFPIESTTRITVPQTPEFASVYKAVKHGAYELIGDTREWKDSKAVRAVHSQLCANDPSYFGVTTVDSPKLKPFLSTLMTKAQEGQQILVYSTYRSTVDKLASMVEGKLFYRKITGEISFSERRQVLEDFWAKKVQVIFMNGAGSQSLNLQCASTILFYDLPWSYGEYTQTVGRLGRLGSPHKNFEVVIFGVEKTMDDRKFATLSKKSQYIQSLGQELETDIKTAQTGVPLFLDLRFIQAQKSFEDSLEKDTEE